MTKIIIGDCRIKIPTLEDESIDCIVTSPPYWGLRDYGHSDQLGLESTRKSILKICCTSLIWLSLN
jgi:DNA modification methylase